MSSASSENIRLSRSSSPGPAGKSPRPSPPRIPLHDRSNSQTNEVTSPTIRIVDDPDCTVYSKSPYPTHPSQILRPRPRNAFAGYVYEDQGSSVSDQLPATNAFPSSRTSPGSETLAPKPPQLRRTNRTSGTSITSDDETITGSSPLVPYSPRFSQDTTPPLSPVLQSLDRVKSLEILAEEPLDKRPTVRAVLPSSSSTVPSQPLNSHPSKASLASTTSDASIIQYHERSSSGSSTNLPSQPLRHAKRPLYAYPRSKKQALSTSKFTAARTQQFSESIPSLPKSRGSDDRPRSASAPAPTYAAFQATSENIAQVQYPIIRPSQASGSWAESRTEQKNPSRMTDRISSTHQWSSQLSTIHSESERHSRSLTTTSGQSHPRIRGATIASIVSSTEIPSSKPTSESSVTAPRPLFSPQPPIPDARDSDERYDTIAELQSPPQLKQQRSGYFSRFSSDSRPSSSWSRPGTSSSSQSDLVNFIANTIPAWARVYYRRGERASLPGPDTSTEASDSRLNTAQSGPSLSPTEPNFPLSIYRPRNRPRHFSQNMTDSMVISEAPMERDLYVVRQLRDDLRDGYGTPRLHLDRRSTAHLSAWRAPSFNDTWGSLFSRGNRQILLFGIGFIFPLAWILGAILPLPSPPELSKEATQSQIDLERVMSRNLGPIDELNYQKARWWRNLNRIMSIVGVLLIATIIALAIIAARMAMPSR